MFTIYHLVQDFPIPSALATRRRFAEASHAGLRRGRAAPGVGAGQALQAAGNAGDWQKGDVCSVKNMGGVLKWKFPQMVGL